MKLRDMLNRIRKWLRGSRRRQAGAIVVGLGILALPVYLVAFSGGDERGEEVRSMPSPSPEVAQTSEPTPQVIGGVQVEPLKFGGEVELPGDVALIVATGCTECDGPPTGLIRVYRDASGEVRTDLLFEVDLLGLQPRLLETEKGTQEEEPYFSTFGLNSDGSDIVVGVCTRGYCGPFNAITADAQMTLFRSLDGGVTWAEFAVFDGTYNVVAIAKDGVVLTGPYDADPDTLDHPGYQFFPSGDPLEPPAQAGLSWPISLPSGDLLWPTEDGRLLRSDGSEFLDIGAGLRLAGGLSGLLHPDRYSGELPLVLWREASTDYYLAVVDPGGRLTQAFSLDGFARVGGWLDHGVIVGNAVVPAERLTTVPPELSTEYLTVPSLIDLDDGRVQPIPDPFLDRYGRNNVLAVVEGPFARVVGTGSCLNIRAADGRVLDCAADSVLLRVMGATGEIGGETVQHVVTPAGTEGWASTAYLEVKPAPVHPKFPSVTVNPAAHEAFLAWFERYLTEQGFTTDNLPVGFQEGGACWVVHDSSTSEYLYGYWHCPGEWGTNVRVFREDTAWKAEQSHFQGSVGKPSWEEIMERILLEYEPAPEVRTVLEEDDVVVVVLGFPDSQLGDVYRFGRGVDGLWRGYLTYDALHGGFGTPEDALIAYALRNFPELPVLGECSQAQPTSDSDKVCWTLEDDAGGRRTYVIGPTFSEGEAVELERLELDSATGASAWRGIPYDRFHPY